MEICCILSRVLLVSPDIDQTTWQHIELMLFPDVVICAVCIIDAGLFKYKMIAKLHFDVPDKVSN